MNEKEVLTKLIEQSPNWTQNKLGMEMGFTSQAMSNRMNRGSLKTNFLIKALNILGYDLVAVPKGSRLPNGSIRVEEGEGK